MKDFDFYRKIPHDLTEGSLYGAILTLFTFIFISFLLISEIFSHFLTTRYETLIVTDYKHENDLLQINFDISLLDIPCSYAIVDIVDIFGIRIDNITFQIQKYEIDPHSSHRKVYEGVDPEDMDILFERINDYDFDSLYGDGTSAPEISETVFDGLSSPHPLTLSLSLQIGYKTIRIPLSNSTLPGVIGVKSWNQFGNTPQR
jgi:hypothetical protein